MVDSVVVVSPNEDGFNNAIMSSTTRLSSSGPLYLDFRSHPPPLDVTLLSAHDGSRHKTSRVVLAAMAGTELRRCFHRQVDEGPVEDKGQEYVTGSGDDCITVECSGDALEALVQFIAAGGWVWQARWAQLEEAFNIFRVKFDPVSFEPVPEVMPIKQEMKERAAAEIGQDVESEEEFGFVAVPEDGSEWEWSGDEEMGVGDFEPLSEDNEEEERESDDDDESEPEQVTRQGVKKKPVNKYDENDFEWKDNQRKKPKKKRILEGRKPKEKNPKKETQPKNVRLMVEGPPFKCDQCQREFSTRQYLLGHIRRLHKREGPVKCDQCELEFSNKLYLRGHVKRVHEGLSFTCEICGFTLASQVSLNYHKISFHGSEEDRPYQCDQCPRGFIKKWRFEAHINKHNGCKVQCELCPFMTYHHHFLMEHKNLSHSDKSKQVKVRRVRRVNGSSGQLKAPSDDKPKPPRVNKTGKRRGIIRGRSFAKGEKEHITCEQCGKYFEGKGSVMRYEDHVLGVHTEESERPFKCHICGKGFGSKRTLNKHFAVHDDSRPFVCAVCNKTFRDVGNRNAHERTVHYGMGKTLPSRRSWSKDQKGQDESPEARKARWMEMFRKQQEEKEAKERMNLVGHVTQ